MPFTVTMPKLSPTMEEGTIAKWHKKVGDHVKSGDLLVEVATDKATVEYNALDEGYLRKILIKEGAHATVNQPIAIFTLQPSENIDQYQPEGISPAPVPEKKVAAPAPALAAHKPTPAPAIAQPAFVPEPPIENYDFEFPAGPANKRSVASPLAKKLAKEKGLDLTSVKGSGPNGRVTSRDLDLAQPSQPISFARREVPTIAPGTFEEIPLTPMRKVIGARLQQSKGSIPHFYVRQEIDAEPLIQIREQLKSGGLNVTFNDFIVRACALALRAHPRINSGFNSVNQSIILFKTVDISIAVSIEAGLITPILRHADYKNLGEISVEVKELAARAKAGKLLPEEYKGGSFTISNLGMYGISDFVAVINPPQSCILAVAGIEDTVRLKNGLAALGKKLNLTLAADHRVVDGADAAKFLKDVQKYLENPSLLLV
ncbi:MAG: pyruvate dehydrogenase complex dihydrolipoamide acetyltransferase [Verrucomicrobiota bacterium]|nr:pyruvate dehydrogenase complex dihydrolipoamide acetyltransferase [Verrucomicrobiota bacterium]